MENEPTAVERIEAWLVKRGFALQTERKGAFQDRGNGYFACKMRDKVRLGPERDWVGIGWRWGDNRRKLRAVEVVLERLGVKYELTTNEYGYSFIVLRVCPALDGELPPEEAAS
jgi:hypothetical protein